MSDGVYIGTNGPDSAVGDFYEMHGNGGGDTLQSTFGGFTQIYGGGGDDHLDYSDAAAGYALIKGQGGDDAIDGGSSGDSLYGGGGGDLITGWASGDLIYGGKGNDTLYGYWKYYDNINDGGDAIYGGSGKDKLFGQSGPDALFGGKGKDVLTGGPDGDTFYFSETPGPKNADVIKDFSHIDDTIELIASFFKHIGPMGVLSAGRFHRGTHAHDNSDRVIYDANTGNLYYDKDGKGGADAVKFAHLSGAPSIDNTDFYVF
jgi:Ca2+-binding RTX toxin-like protein